MNKSTRLYTIFFGLIFSYTRATTNSLRGIHRNDEERELYGLEYGVDGLQDIFAHTEFDGETEDQQQVTIPIGDKEVVLSSYDNSIKTRIVGGDEISLDNLQPNFAMHLTKSPTTGRYHFAGCGGTLISNCHVLTAAHCVADSREGLPHALYINAYKPYEGNAGQPFHFSLVQDVNVHPDYEDASNVHDVAIITLATCIDQNRSSKLFLDNLMKLADENYMKRMVSDGDTMNVSGFGRLEEGDASYSDVLNSVQVPFISYDACRKNYYSQVKEDMVCAGFPEGGFDACQGDSGGPMYVKDGENQYQIGLVSWGSGCARPDKPGVYASVAYHYDYIKTQVCQYALSSDSDLCNDYSSTGTTMPPAKEAATEPPTKAPSRSPTKSPTKFPTKAPTKAPTIVPTNSPTKEPTKAPTSAPVTKSPTQFPTKAPIEEEEDPAFTLPSNAPSRRPTKGPSITPTIEPQEDFLDDGKCQLVDGPCLVSVDCCGSLLCHRRKNICISPNGGKNKVPLSRNRSTGGKNPRLNYWG